MKKLLFAVVAALSVSASVQAETLVYQATSDFPDIVSGEVPYYVHRRESALAIDAGEETYRDKFARATSTYTGSGGVYDVTVAALGEIDGECEFRFLVNGVVVASAVNARVDTDYGVQNHLFEDISIPADAQIAVESNSASNGLVPEGNIFAFARGRWTTLTLESDDNVASSSADLALSTDIDNYSPIAGETININYEVFNESASVIATNPQIEINLPPQLSLAPQSQCNISGTTATCTLPEVGTKQQVTLSVSATATQSGTGDLSSTISADQPDNVASNNTSTTSVDVTAVETPVSQSVDLSVVATSDKTTAVTDDIVTYSITATNEHPSTVATSPTVGIALPGGMSFNTSSDCTASGRSVTCDLPELAVGDSSVVNFSATVAVPGTATLIVSVSAAEAEETVADNEILYSVSVTEPATPVVDPDRNNTTPDSVVTTTTDSSSGGGGSVTNPLNLFLLLAFINLTNRLHGNRRRS